tara:strand:+ start:17533 stop:18249 length:717 start_codon:yes stop_codon:yes gene_type:complete
MNPKELVKGFFKKCGYTLIKSDFFPTSDNLAIFKQHYPNPKEFKTIIDSGANIGQSALAYSRDFPKANIYSFEPVKDTFAALKNNTSNCPHVHCIHKGLGPQEASLAISINPDSQQSSLAKSDPSLPSETVQITTLDQFCQEQNIDQIDLLKTDTEGFDLEVLKGAKNLLKEGKITFILSEAGFHKHDKQHTNFHELSRMLEGGFDYGFLGIYEPIYNGHCHLSHANALFVKNHGPLG